MTFSTGTDQGTPSGAGQPQFPSSGELRLPRMPGLFRRWLAMHPVAVDWIIVGTYLFGCALMLGIETAVRVIEAINIASSVSTDLDSNSDAITSFNVIGQWYWLLVRLAGVAAIAVALKFRRRYPAIGVAVVSAVLWLEPGLLVMPNAVALCFLMYAAPVYRGVLSGWISFLAAALLNTLAIVVSGSVYTGVIGPTGVLGSGPLSMADSVLLGVLNCFWLLIILLVGISYGNRQRYVHALIDRATQLAREREQQAELAAAAERARIAREMHDIVAHSLSVVVTLTEGALVSVDQRPEAAKQALERASETGRSALEEMRRLLGVLRDPGTPGEATQEFTRLEPQPGATDLHRLVEGFRTAGLLITCEQVGIAPTDKSHQLATFRIVQEALTNSLRYAGQGAQVVVRIEHFASETFVSVVDSGRSPGAILVERVTPNRVAGQATESHPRYLREGEQLIRQPGAGLPGSGMGLLGAAQRAELFGGSLTAGAQGAGWAVQAVIPVQANNERQM